MHNTVCRSFASSLLKPKEASSISRYIKQPILQWTRQHHDRCEPRHISWQWRAKGTPELQKCQSLCVKKKPKKRFFPRFKKEAPSKDPQQCEKVPPDQLPKPLSWSEYFSFLLPDEYTKKPPMVMCRKMLEHRRRKCIGPDDYLRCIRGECWPPPTEWYGQGVLHLSELGLVKPDSQALCKPCPPAAHLISRCTSKQGSTSSSDKLCTESDPFPAMPYTQFKGASSDGTFPPVTLKCPISYKMDLLPRSNLDKSYKLSCKSYGEVKEVECPPQMFNRYMNVDFTSKNLLPIPTTSQGQKPLREIKKGVCGRQTLLRPPSARNFSTGRVLLSNDLPEFIKIVDTSRLQPSRSAICCDKLVDRAGMNADLLQKPILERTYESNGSIAHFTEKELEKHEQEAKKSEETEEERLKKINDKKSKLQLLVEKKKAEINLNEGSLWKSSSGGGDPTLSQPFLNRTLVDLEDVPYQRSSFHTSASLVSRKSDRDMRSKNSPRSKDDDEKICSGCPGIRAAGSTKPRSKCSTLKGGAKGRCRVDRPLRPEERLKNPLTAKCKAVTDSPCMRPSKPVSLKLGNRFFHQYDRLLKPGIYVKNSSVVNRFDKAAYGQQSKDLLDQCCEQLDQLKKQIDLLRKDKDKAKNQDPCQKTDDKKAKENKASETDPCKTQENKKSEDTKPKSTDCKQEEKKSQDCKKVIEKKKKAEDCVKYMEKQNEKLRKELEKMKKQYQRQESDQCAQLEAERKKAEEQVKRLVGENQKLKKCLQELAKKLDQSKTSKRPDPCAESKNRQKRRENEDAGEGKGDVDNCVKRCTNKAKKKQIKMKLKEEKMKCSEALKEKRRQMEKEQGIEDDSAGLNGLVDTFCQKLQHLTRKTKKPKKC